MRNAWNDPQLDGLYDLWHTEFKRAFVDGPCVLSDKGLEHHHAINAAVNTAILHRTTELLEARPVDLVIIHDCETEISASEIRPELSAALKLARGQRPLLAVIDIWLVLIVNNGNNRLLGGSEHTDDLPHQFILRHLEQGRGWPKVLGAPTTGREAVALLTNDGWFDNDD